MTTAAPPVLILPGLEDSGPEHWQTRWLALRPGLRRVEQREWLTPACADWAAALDAAVVAAGPAAILVAHSAACPMVAHWAAAQHRAIGGALLVAPADADAPSFPRGPTGFAPVPLGRLPFPAVVVASRDDPYVAFPRALAFAAAWGARLVDAGAHGHLNTASGLGDWPLGLALLDGLIRQVRAPAR
jgi:uncharacterized protein